MKGSINGVHGGGIVHTIRIEGRPFQTWVFDDWGVVNTANGSYLKDLP